MNKGVIYYTKIREEYKGAHMEHMIAEKLLEIGLKKEFGIDLEYEPRAEGEHGKPFLSYRLLTIALPDEYVEHGNVALLYEEVGIDVQIHRKANYERMLERMVTDEKRREILAGPDVEKEFFTQWVLREAYIKWTGEGLSRDLRNISMEEGTCMLLDMEEGYSGALWTMNPMEICWKFEHVMLG